MNLARHLKTAVSSPTTPDSVYKFEAEELFRLKNAGLLTTALLKPMSSVTCSFYQLDLSVNYSVPSNEGKVMASDVNLSPYARCGTIFGPEQMFGQVMRTFYTDPFSIIKVAAGGSEIKNNWSKESGSFWPELMENLVEPIDTTTEAWRGIVWFQGENDSLNKTKSSEYLVELTKFIANLRYAMFQVDTTTFAQPEDIPVVIIGLGCWLANNVRRYGKAVMDAQRAFVNTTCNTALVRTDDLSCHAHFDDASQIIIGARLANTLRRLTAPSTNATSLARVINSTGNSYR